MAYKKYNQKTLANIEVSFNDPQMVDGMIKKGLLFYEGEHRCNKNNTWVVSPEDIMEIAENTNRALEQQPISVFLNHQDTPENHVGYVTGRLISRQINPLDVEKKPELAPLLGKYALFCDEIEIRDSNIINKLKQNLAKSVSCTIDFGHNVLKSLSLVGMGALPYAAMFSSPNIPLSTISYNEAIAANNNRDNQSEKLRRKFDIFCELLERVRDMDESLLQDKNREELYTAIIGEFSQDILQELECITHTGQTTKNPTNFGVALPLNTAEFAEMYDYDFGDYLEDCYEDDIPPITMSAVERYYLGRNNPYYDDDYEDS
jgi:hypothetical protein